MNQKIRDDFIKTIEELKTKLSLIIKTGEQLIEMYNNNDKKNSEYLTLHNRMMQAYDLYKLCKCNKCANKYLMYQRYVWLETRKLDIEIEHTNSLLSEFEEKEIHVNDPEY